MAIKAGDILWQIDADASKLSKAIDKSKGDLKKLGTNFGDVSKKAGIAMTAAGAAGVAAIGGLVSKSQEFSQAMAEVNTLGVQDLGAMGDAVKDVSARFGLDLTNSANAAYQAISAGASEAEAPRLLEEAAIAATAGVTDLSTAIELGTSVTNAFGMGIGQASQIFDEAFIAVKGGVTTFEELSSSVGKLSPIMSAAGVSSAEMFASIGALTKGGIATSESVTGMKAVIQSILNPTSEAAQMAEELGIQFDVAALQSQGLAGFMDTLRDATGGNIESMSALFASSEALNAALALTGNQAESFSSLMAQMQNSTGASQEAFDAFVEANPGFAFEQLKSTIAVLAVEIGDKLAPILIALAEKIKPVVMNIIEWVRNNQQLAGFIATVAAAASALMVVLGPILVMLPGLATAFSAVSAIVPAVGAAIAALTGPIGALIALGVALTAAVIANWTEIKDFIRGAVDAVIGFFGNLWDAAQNAFANIGNFISNKVGFVSNVILGLLGPIGQVIGALKDLWNWMTKTEGGGVQGFASGGLVKGFASGGKIEGFASGGRIIQVGERGPELLALPSTTGSDLGRVMSNHQMETAVQAGQRSSIGNLAPSFNITVNGNTDPYAMVEALKGPFSAWMRDELVLAMR